MTGSHSPQDLLATLGEREKNPNAIKADWAERDLNTDTVTSVLLEMDLGFLQKLQQGEAKLDLE